MKRRVGQLRARWVGTERAVAVHGLAAYLEFWWMGGLPLAFGARILLFGIFSFTDISSLFHYSGCEFVSFYIFRSSFFER